MTTTEVTPTLSVKDAAQRLADLLGGTAERWRVWLSNDRRPGRAQQLTPVMGPGRPRYQLAALEAFVTTERATRLKESGPSGRIAEVLKAVGIGEEGGSSTGRRLDCQVAGEKVGSQRVCDHEASIARGHRQPSRQPASGQRETAHGESIQGTFDDQRPRPRYQRRVVIGARSVVIVDCEFHQISLALLSDLRVVRF